MSKDSRELAKARMHLRACLLSGKDATSALRVLKLMASPDEYERWNSRFVKRL